MFSLDKLGVKNSTKVSGPLRSFGYDILENLILGIAATVRLCVFQPVKQAIGQTKRFEPRTFHTLVP